MSLNEEWISFWFLKAIVLTYFLQFIKNAYTPFIIDKVIKKNLDYKFYSNQNQLKDTLDVHYFKLPYIGNLSHHLKNKLSKLCKVFCKGNFSIKLVFNSFKIKNYFSYNTPCNRFYNNYVINICPRQLL